MWIETKLSDDPIAAVKLALASHSTGQLVLHVSEGTVRAAVWREKVTTPNVKPLDRTAESSVPIQS